MKLVRTVGLCLMAVFALNAMTASSASATDLLARAAGGGSVAGVTFLSSVTLPLIFFHNGGILDMHCKNATNHGLFLSTTLGIVLVRFLGCTISNGGGGRINCKSTGAGAGEIHLVLSTLFHLGLANLGTNNRIPALVILPGSIIEIDCELVLMHWSGALIGALQLENGSPVPSNTPISKANLNFQQTAKGLQHLRLILMPGSTAPTTYNLESSLTEGTFELMSVVANDKLHLFRLSNGNHVNIELVVP